MLVEDLRAKSKDELKNLVQELKAELFMLRFKNSTGQLDQPHKIALVKKDIAKVFTILNGKNPGPVVKKAPAKKTVVKKAAAKPATKPAAKPATKPAAGKAPVKPAAKPVAKPAPAKSVAKEVKEGK